MATIFSRIIAGEIPCYKIAENDKFFAFLDISPMTKGHTLVVPKIEEDYLFDLDDDLLSEMIVFSKKIAKAQKETMDCVRVGVTVIGLEVPHAHIIAGTGQIILHVQQYLNSNLVVRFQYVIKNSIGSVNKRQ